MRTVVVDKIASVTQACGLGNEVRVSTENIPSEEGVVVVVEILTNKSTYNTLELTSGRMAKVGKGDIVAGALGHRKALFGYSGHVPESVKPGDIIQMLNIGGVLGIVDSVNPDKGKPFDCRVIGGVLHFPYLGERIGVPARVGYRPLDFAAPLITNGVPVVALAGTCMEAGKTAAAAAIISRMVGPALTRTMLTELAEKKPDVIVFELGDGLLGTYGVDSILEQEDIRKALTGVVLSANDPVAAYGGVDILRKRFSIEPIAVTGPATDNDVGVSIIRDQLKVPAFNALAAGAALGDSIIESVGLTKARPLDRAANE
jgi:hypothetical protein